jgi:hypothetical protein
LSLRIFWIAKVAMIAVSMRNMTPTLSRRSAASIIQVEPRDRSRIRPAIRLVI